MNLISIDYGFKYIGLSLGNFNFKNYLPILIVKNNSYFFFLLKIFILKFYIKFFIIGFSLNFKEIKSYINLIFLLKKFIIKLNNIYSLKIFLINEDYSSYIFYKKFDHISSMSFIKTYLNY